MHNASLQSRFRGAFLGVAIGDGMGMPVETWKHDRIIKLNGGNGVTGFMSPVQTRLPETAKLAPGGTTDDWQLTAAIARSLVRMGGNFDLGDCLQEHIEEWKIDNGTWGKGSREAIAQLARGERSMTEPPASIEGKTGMGNGVIMKIAPLALATLAKTSEMCASFCRSLGRLTHGDIRASIAAYAVMRLMQATLKRRISSDISAPSDDLLCWLIWEVEGMEKDFGDPNTSPDDRVSGRLRRIHGSLEGARFVREKLGCSFTAIETAPFTIATFLRHPVDFRAGVLEAVNAGGDTDSNASIVGSLIGMNVGVEGIPPEWVDQCPVHETAIELADALYRNLIDR